jgi:hypothetical protein
MIGYIKNEKLMGSAHKDGKNFWEVYLEEILHEMGATFEAVPVDAMEDPGRLLSYSALLIGAQTGSSLTESAKTTLREWVAGGGLLIGFMTKGLDPVFGIDTISEIKEKDTYKISAYYEFLPHELTRNIHPHIFLEQKLIILSDQTMVTNSRAQPLAYLYDDKHEDTGCPAITWNHFGKGSAAYFAFDPAKTIWILHQGRPLYDIKETQVSPRSAEGFVLENNSYKIPYADMLVYLLMNILSTQVKPFVYTLPPHEGKVPDASIIWGGDEYFGPTHLSLYASDFMRSLGLPYHINIESENHPITPDEFNHIVNENGHEISLYILLDENDRISPERIREQSDMLMKRFGITPGCCLFNVVRWYGWAEPARWLAEAGGTAIHSKMPGNKLISHPCANSTAFGMAAGTANPFHYYDNAENNNAFIPCIEIPPVGYELGHNGSTGVRVEVSDDGTEHLGLEAVNLARGDDISINYDDVHLPIDMAVKYHTLSHFFFHPLYITEYPECRNAIHEIIRYISYLGVDVYHMANNQAADWWDERRKARAICVSSDSKGCTFKTESCETFGMIIKFPVNRAVKNVICDGKETVYRIIQDFGKDWLHIVITSGTKYCEVRYS